MTIQELVPLAGKTTMRIGGTARYFAELRTKEEAEEAWKFVKDKNIPFIILGGGANTVFADGTINALVIRIAAERLEINGNRVTVETGLALGTLVMKLAAANLDISPLTGIPGTVGGAIFGNAGQGFGGIWTSYYVQTVTAFDGVWRTYAKEECEFAYRESVFKRTNPAPLIWEASLIAPARPQSDIKSEIERILWKRLEAQPHVKTAGSCFKSLHDGTPAWKVIDAAGLRGLKKGGVMISDKHANFLINTENGTFQDVLSLVREARAKVPELEGIEMRLIGENGRIVE